MHRYSSAIRHGSNIMSHVTADNRAVIHGASHAQCNAFPNVCLTPSPTGPIPTPYPSVSSTQYLKKGSRNVRINRAPIAIATSELSTSSGDEAGTLGGVLSKTNSGKVIFATSSPFVRIEDQGVVRNFDVTQHNVGIVANTPPGVIVGDL
jgi:hypothetical protein